LTHPCQILADLLTVIENFGTYEGKTVAYIGDGNNMANSWINAAKVLGFKLQLACPAGYFPKEGVFEPAKKILGDKLLLTSDPLEAAKGAHAINTDVWASMGQETEALKRQEVFKNYTVDAKVMAQAADDAIFLHCLPAHRGEEVSEEVFESSQSRVFDEAENRLHAQKALMATLMG